jgi:hypothetical protein
VDDQLFKIKRALPHNRWNALYYFKNRGLNDRYIYGSGTFLALLYIKGNPVAFIQRLETGCINSAMMHEHIRTIFLLDKAIALAAVKPFYNSISHSAFLNNSHGSKLQVATLTYGSFPQNETGPPIKAGPLLIILNIAYFLKESSH